MRIAIIALATLGALSLAACESKADKTAEAQSDAIKAEANVAATQMENKADTMESAGAPNATTDAMDNKADAMKDAADAKGDAIEKEAGKKY